MMNRKRSIDVEVIANPHKDYQGKPLQALWCRWYAQDGTECIGEPSLSSLLGAGMGLVAEPGDRLHISVEAWRPAAT
jgi:hypothetical protein